MKIEFELREEDYLTFQLYAASTSERIKKKRQRSRWRVPLAYLLIGGWFLIQDKYVISVLFIVVAIAWFFVYPLWERRHYFKHYQDHIREHYAARFNQFATLTFDENNISTKDRTGESTILSTEIIGIIEIPQLIMIAIRGGQSYLLPKQRLANPDGIISRLQELSRQLNIQYKVENHWVWK